MAVGKPFKKGQSGNPSGRKPLLPEVQRALDYNRNALKALILDKIDGKVADWVDKVIEKGTEQGDMFRLKMLIEMAVGKMDETPDFPLTEEEKLLVLEFRRRKSERAIEGSS